MSPVGALALVVLNVLVAGVVALLLFRLIAPTGSKRSNAQTARRWCAWAVAASTVALLPRVLRSLFAADAVALWMLGMLALGVIAFAAGWAWSAASGAAQTTQSEAKADSNECAQASIALDPKFGSHTSISRAGEKDDMNGSDDVYERIAAELDGGELQRGLWIRLFAECNGDETRTKVAYIKERAAQLQQPSTVARRDASSLKAPASRAPHSSPADGPRPDPELVEAVWNGNWSRGNALVAEGRPAQGVDERGLSLVDLAAKRGDRLMLELLERSLRPPQS